MSAWSMRAGGLATVGRSRHLGDISTGTLVAYLSVINAVAIAAISIAFAAGVISWIVAVALCVLILIFDGAVVRIHGGWEREAALTEDDLRARRLIKRWPLAKVSDVDPFEDLRVASSSIANRYREGEAAPPYVRRDVDGQLDEAITNHDFVILTGPSNAGKSRSLYEACKRLACDEPIVIPNGRASLREILDTCATQVPLSSNLVLWLDDLERFIESGGLTTSLVDEWTNRPGRTRILATMRSREYDRLLSETGEIGKTVRDALRRGAVIRMTGALNEEERRRAREVYPGLELGSGIGEQFVAADELIARLQNGVSTHPAGAALVLAALDCRRTGLGYGLPHADVVALSKPYFNALSPTRIWGESIAEEGFEWACEPIESTSALLQGIEIPGDRIYVVPDFILEWYESNAAQLHPTFKNIPTHVWDYTIERVDTRAINGLAYLAYVRGYREASESLLIKGVASEDRAAQASAFFNLGLLYEAQGRIGDSISAYRSAIKVGEPDSSSSAAFNVALLLAERDRVDEAIEAYREALRLGHPDTVPRAAINLGVLLGEKGLTSEAISAYEIVLEIPNSELYAHALLNLGHLFLKIGNPEKAMSYWEQVVDLENTEQRTQAAYNLGLLHQQYRRTDKAVRYYTIAANGEHTEERLWALNNLGALYYELPDGMDKAEHWWREALNSSDPEVVVRAAENLGMLFEAKEDLDEAAAMYRRAVDVNHPATSPRAALGLGTLLKSQDNLPEAAQVLKLATRSDDAEIASKAAFNLGWVLTRLDSPKKAIEAYQLAVQYDQEEIYSGAAINLGILLENQGCTEGAIKAYQSAIDSDHPTSAPKAAILLGVLLMKEERLDEARNALELARSMNAPEVSATAEELLRNLQDESK